MTHFNFINIVFYVILKMYLYLNVYIEKKRRQKPQKCITKIRLLGIAKLDIFKVIVILYDKKLQLLTFQVVFITCKS